MRQQSYLVRKGDRYHFRHRLACDYVCSHAISVSLNTADPAEARRLARRLAVKWDEIAMYAGQVHERGTLTLKEQKALFRSGMEEELAQRLLRGNVMIACKAGIWNGISATYRRQHNKLGADGVRDTLERLMAAA